MASDACGTRACAGAARGPIFANAGGIVIAVSLVAGCSSGDGGRAAGEGERRVVADIAAELSRMEATLEKLSTDGEILGTSCVTPAASTVTTKQ